MSMDKIAAEVAIKELLALAEKATPGPWKTRGGDRGVCMFVQAPRLKPEHRYDIEVLGEDRQEENYPPELAEADCAFVAAARNAIPAIAALSQSQAERDAEIEALAKRWDNWADTHLDGEALIVANKCHFDLLALLNKGKAI